MSINSHSFFVDSSFLDRPGPEELPPAPWSKAVMPEFRYTYDVLERALPEVKAEGLRFYFTKDAYSLPEYGPHVVAVLLQEERCKVPVYGRHVRAVLRNLETTPSLGFSPHPRMGRLEAVLLFEYARDLYTHNKSVRAFRAPHPGWGTPVHSEPVVVSLPLGYHSQVDLPQVSMQDRTLDLFFSGQISHPVPKNDYRYWISTSKFIGRAQIWRVLNQLQQKGEWNLDLGSLAGGGAQERSGSYGSYSEKMMQSRICVSPRGSVGETFRSFEGLRAGCWVIGNPVPRGSLLYDAPITVVQHWAELEGLLRKYARNFDFLEEQRAKSLAYWRDHCTPETWAGRVRQALNQG